MKKEVLESGQKQGYFDWFLSSVKGVLRIEENLSIDEDDIVIIRTNDSEPIRYQEIYEDTESSKLEESPIIFNEADADLYEKSDDVVEIVRATQAHNERLLKHAEINESRAFEFFESVREGKIEDVKALLASGIDVNFSDEVGNTAVLEAVRVGDVDVIKLLIEHGADLQAVTKGGSSVLSYANANESWIILKLLAQHGVLAKPSATQLSNSQWHFYRDKTKLDVLAEEVNLVCAIVK